MTNTPVRRRWSRRLLLLGAGALGALALLALVDLLRIRGELAAGQDALQSLDLEAAASPGGIAAVSARSATHLHAAARLARSSPWLQVVEVLPVVRDQVEGLRAMADAGDALGAAARSAGAEVDAAMQEASAVPAARLTLLDVTSSQLDKVDRVLATIDVGSGRGLVAPFSTARSDLLRRVATARLKLVDAKRSVAALRRLLAGPSKLLVLGANNAEMTAGSGMPLSGGVAAIEGGDLNLGDFRPTDTAQLGARGVAPPGDLPALYHLMGMGADFRGTTASPVFPTTAPLMAQMAARSIYGPVDGIAVVDAVALRDLLRVTGAVNVDGIDYDDQNVLREVLNQNYLRFGDPMEARGARVELQGAIAKAAFDALKTRHVPIGKLVKAMRGSSEGRHLLLWSADPDLEKVWSDIGAAGAVPPDGMLVAPENYDGDKLDWYLRPRMALDLRRAPDRTILADLSVTIDNPRRNPTSPQIEGASPNEHFVWLDLHLPAAAGPVTSYDHPLQGTGLDPPSRVAIMLDYIPTGESRTWRFSWTLPADMAAIRLLPSARVAPLDYTINGFSVDDSVARYVPLIGVPGPPGPPSPLVVTGFVLLVLGAGFALSAARAGGLPGPLEPSSFDSRAATALLGIAALLFLLAAW